MSRLTGRLETILNFIVASETFADVGCDHGQIAKAILDRGICSKVYITDISQKSLNKAVKLLLEYIDNKAFAICCDGLSEVPKVDEVLISGIGGEEIVRIITRCQSLPKTFILQPMKNASKVRRLLTDLGYAIVRDTMFKDRGKFYDIIVGRQNERINAYSELEFEFGRENLKGNPVFLDYLNCKIKNYSLYCEQKLSLEAEAKLQKLIEVRDEITRNL